MITYQEWLKESLEQPCQSLEDVLIGRDAPGVKDGVIVDASYWLWIDAERKLPFDET